MRCLDGPAIYHRWGGRLDWARSGGVRRGPAGDRLIERGRVQPQNSGNFGDRLWMAMQLLVFRRNIQLALATVPGAGDRNHAVARFRENVAAGADDRVQMRPAIDRHLGQAQQKRTFRIQQIDRRRLTAFDARFEHVAIVVDELSIRFVLGRAETDQLALPTRPVSRRAMPLP